MFTGLVEAMAELVEVRPKPPGVTLVLRCRAIQEGTALGDSIAINGCCLTVVAVRRGELSFEAGPETLSRTNLGQLAAGDMVNVERSLKVGDRLGGHFVTGHIDAVGSLAERRDDADWSMLWFTMAESLAPYLASKGSIAVDGVSLTLVDVEPRRFSVALIPHTLAVTTLGRRKVGDTVNLETDLLAKYVANWRKQD
jgi:riboflavin synthase